MTENTTSRSILSLASVRSVPRRFVAWLAAQNSFVIMGVFFALGFLADRTPALESVDWMFFLAGGLLPIVLATVSTDEDGYDHDISNDARVKFVVSQLLFAITPWGILTQVLQVVGTVTAYLRYLGRLPNRDRHVPETTLTLPFDGEWSTVNSGVTKHTSHS